MIKVLFVCLGNICRSPLAQGVFEKKASERGWESLVYADSAGVSGWHQGAKPHNGSISVAMENGVSIENQRSRIVVSLDHKEFDYIIAMDDSNLNSLLHEFGMDEKKVYRMRSFSAQKDDLNVPDPYGQGNSSFQLVYNILDESMDSFMDFLKKNHSSLS